MRTQNQFQKDTQMRKYQKFIIINNDELIVKNYPKKKQPINQQQIFKPPNFPIFKQKNWLEFDKGYYCQVFEYISDKPKREID